jgi:3-oxoacyl-[acyl-carrier protein] reductase
MSSVTDTTATSPDAVSENAAVEPRFEGHVAIVTGAAQGLGLATAELLAASGAAVALFDLNQERVDAESARLASAGMAVESVAADLTDQDETHKAVSQVLDRHGRVDILVNLAAIYSFCSFEEMTFDYWHRTIAATLDTTFCCCKAVLPHMKAAGYGRIVNTSSGAVLMGAPETAPYTAAKAGIIGFSRVLAREVGPHGITVNVIMPGLIGTEHALESVDDAGRQATIAMQSVPRLGEPADIANAIAFLVSRESGFVTGQTVNVGGGINYI